MNRNRLKTLAAALVVASSLAATTARAEDVYYQYREENQNALMFDPGALINGVANFEYERALNELFGITVGMNIDSYKSAWYANAPGYVAIGPELGVRFHFIRAAPRGFWIGPYLDLAYVAAHDRAGTTTSVGYGLGGALGYNFVFFRHFLLSLGVGGGFGDYGYGIRGDPRFRLGVGAVF